MRALTTLKMLSTSIKARLYDRNSIERMADTTRLPLCAATCAMGRVVYPSACRFALALLLLAASLVPVKADEAIAQACLKASPTLGLGAGLPRLKMRLASNQAALIVAIGSSSTRGVGASSWAATYPEVMQRELQRLKPSATIEIANVGSNGETISGQISRMERDALAKKPALVIWQLGSNDVVWPWGGISAETESSVVDAIRRIQAEGADVVLMDLQNSPMVAGASLRQAMLDLTARAAKKAGAGHFQRYNLLSRAVSAGVPLSALTSWDQLHNTDAAYDCTGRAIARAIHAAAK